MLYIFWGHRFWARRYLDSLLGKAREKGRVISHIAEGSEEPLSTYLAEGLFAEKLCVWAEDLLQNREREAELKDIAVALQASPNIFIFLEEEVSASGKKLIEKVEAKVEEIKTPSKTKLLAWAAGESEKLGASLSEQELELIIEEAESDPWTISALLLRRSVEKKIAPVPRRAVKEPNYFDFADAASARNLARSLGLLHKYMQEGFGAEESFWKLWWKIKTLRMVEAGLSAGEANIHPFVAKKAGEDLGRWRRGELKKFSGALQDLFSEVRRGERDFEEGLLALLLR